MHFHVTHTPDSAGKHDVVRIDNGEVAEVIAQADSRTEGRVIAAEARATAVITAVTGS